LFNRNNFHLEPLWRGALTKESIYIRIPGRASGYQIRIKKKDLHPFDEGWYVSTTVSPKYHYIYMDNRLPDYIVSPFLKHKYKNNPKYLDLLIASETDFSFFNRARATAHLLLGLY
jgi:hypothetical protein